MRPLKRRLLAPIPSRPLVAVALVGSVDLDVQLRAALRADLVEVRLDTFPALLRAPSASAAVLRHVSATSKKPVLLTCRHPRESGAKKPASLGINEAARLKLYSHLLPVVDAVDIEVAAPFAAALARRAKRAGCAVIQSAHFFNGPSSVAAWRRLERRSRTQGADIFKIAIMPRTEKDVLSFLAWGVDVQKPVVLIAMGELGVPSRFAAFSAGSRITYAHAGGATAPGQVGVGTLRRAIDRIYRS